MRYEGLTQDVKAIENVIAHGEYCVAIKKPKYLGLFGEKSNVEAHVFDVLPPGRRHQIRIRFHYDDRDGHSTIDIKNSDIGWIWELSPDMIKLLAKLEAQQEVKVCVECGSYNIVHKDSYWWCNSCHLPTSGIRTRWVSIKESEDIVRARWVSIKESEDRSGIKSDN